MLTGRGELYKTCATVLAALVLVAVWWSRRHGVSTREGRNHSGQQTAGDREEKKAMEKKEKSERKEAKSARARAAAEQRVHELTSRLDAARSSPSPQAAPLVLAAVDVEAWEGNSNLITEIGLAFFVVEGARSTFRHRHIIVQEHLTLRNGTFVEDNRGRWTYRAFTHARTYATTHARTLSLSLALVLALALSRSLVRSLSLTVFFLSRFLTLPRSSLSRLPRSLTRARALSFAPSLWLSLSLPRSPARSLARTHTLSLSHTHTHIRAHTCPSWHSYFERATVKRRANMHAPVHAFMGS